ncbi:RluA family pseudouridine synthase [Erysipelotrichaceae bacterium OH741_COT-311]|nr:RluA family pseudouridine synthase [Erysipelotrichaceae bacterium OH741_COT-311]
MCKQLQIEQELDCIRLDKYLALHTEFSRSRIQQLIDEECIYVNDTIVKANYKLKLKDEIKIKLPEIVETIAKPMKMDLDIVYEDTDLLVINKQKGLVVHPGNGNYDNTLVNGLLYYCKDLSGINGVLRPGIVHRIDKDTSGLLIVCKNDFTHQAIAKQLEEKTCKRKYLALVHGVIPHDYGTIDAPIGRDSKDRQKMTVTQHNSKNAITHFKVIKRYDKYTLVECELLTGRTHQIRVHMQYIKYPIVGDPRYGYKKTLETQGQMLHAYQITFTHPRTNEVMTLEAQPPEIFRKTLAFIEGEI